VRLAPNDIEPQIELAKTYNNLGMVSADTMAWYQKALAVREQLLRLQPQSSVPRYELAGTLLEMGRYYGKQGQPAEGIQVLKRAKALLKEALALNPAHVGCQARLGSALLDLAKQQRSQGDWPGALHHFEEAQVLFTRLARTNPEEFGEDANEVAREITLCQQKPTARSTKPAWTRP